MEKVFGRRGFGVVIIIMEIIFFFGFFNVIDGVVLYEGCVLIMMINKFEFFDEVFVCLGCVDF